MRVLHVPTEYIYITWWGFAVDRIEQRFFIPDVVPNPNIWLVFQNNYKFWLLLEEYLKDSISFFVNEKFLRVLRAPLF